jgi:hypothetical protein
VLRCVHEQVARSNDRRLHSRRAGLHSRELDIFFSTLLSVAEGFHLKTWRQLRRRPGHGSTVKEGASLIWQSAAQLVEDALSKLLGNNMLFIDRHDAGKQLAERLLALKDENPVVLALARGGVSVGFEVAHVLA